MYEHDTAGNKIEPAYLYPCPVNCSRTAGCDECRTWGNKNKDTLPNCSNTFELSPEEEKAFYDKVFERKYL